MLVFFYEVRISIKNMNKYLQNVHQKGIYGFGTLKKVYVFGMVLLVYYSIFVRILLVYARFARIC